MKKFLFIILIIIILASGIFIISQKSAKQENEEGKIKIVSTLFPTYDFAQEIGGDKVSVTLLLPPGLEAHSFEPKPSDIIKINQADIFLYSGELMEPWAGDIRRGLSGNVKVIDSSFGIEMIEGLEHHSDPHIWLDFENAKTIATTITDALKEIDPKNASYYQENLENYHLKLTALDDSYRATLETCENREIIYGGHYAFGYLAKRYNLNYKSAQGLAPNSEPSANELIYLVEEIKAKEIKYVFHEELLSPKIAETLARETKTKLLLLNAAHNLSRDDYQAGLTFIAIMENNLKNLSVGLNCELK